MYLLTPTYHVAMRTTTYVQREHRVVIPPAIRESLEIERGDVVEIEVRPVEKDD